jgi:signal transduction histidine kinase/ActR/RegA family two-component response regulator
MSLARGTILLVDDEPEILTALRDLLEDDYDVWSADAPQTALEILAQEPSISVIVSDQRMPEMTGDVLLTKARAISDAQSILLTGYADLDAVVNAINRGGISGYAQKPWEPVLLLSMIGNAHAQCHLQRALNTEQSLLRGLLDGSEDCLSFKDRDGRFVRINHAKAATLGGVPGDWIGRHEGISAAEADVFATGRMMQVIEDVAAAEGLRSLQVTRVPIRAADGAITHLAKLEHDITDRRRMESRLHQAEKMQALGTMAGGVAHDFNNLLTAILGSLELALRRNDGDARLERLLRNATVAAERGTALTQRLLSFSRQRDLALRSVDANDCIREMQDLILRSIGEGIMVEQNLAGDLWPAHVDPDQLELAVLNLCINARDAMPGGGRITLATRNVTAGGEGTDLARGDYVVVSVGDTGTGIPPEVLARVFEPFFTTKPVGKGTGLGLSMVYGLAQQAGGVARVTSAAGEGTSVEMLLPRSHEPPAARG